MKRIKNKNKNTKGMEVTKVSMHKSDEHFR